MTSVIALAPFAEAAVGRLRASHDWSAARGVAAHLTLLGPFLAPSDITPGTVAALRRVFAAQEPIPLALGELRLLGSAACLMPGADERLTHLTNVLRHTWPQARASGRHHLTVARGWDAALYERVAAHLTPWLPLRGEIREAALVERRMDRSVGTVARFSLEGRAGDAGQVAE